MAHAPAAGVNDLDDLPHKGFQALRDLIEKYEPRFFLHGHVHANYSRGFKREDVLGKTTVVNAYEYYVIHYPDQ